MNPARTARHNTMAARAAHTLQLGLSSEAKRLRELEHHVADYALVLEDYHYLVDVDVLNEMIFTTQIVRLDGKLLPLSL